MSPFSWKYLTNGAAFCLKFVSLLWVAFKLSSGRPCCSARLSNLSLSLWLVQARNTTKSGVQICGEHQTSRQAFNIPTNVSVGSGISLFWVCGGCHIFDPLCFCQHISRATAPHKARRSYCYYSPCKWYTSTHRVVYSGPPNFWKILFAYSQISLQVKINIGQTLPKVDVTCLEGKWLLSYRYSLQ